MEGDFASPLTSTLPTSTAKVLIDLSLTDASAGPAAHRGAEPSAQSVASTRDALTLLMAFQMLWACWARVDIAYFGRGRWEGEACPERRFFCSADTGIANSYNFLGVNPTPPGASICRSENSLR